MRDQFKRQLEPLVRELVESVDLECRAQFISAFLDVCAELCPIYYHDAQKTTEAMDREIISRFLKIAQQITGGGTLC